MRLPYPLQAVLDAIDRIGTEIHQLPNKIKEDENTTRNANNASEEQQPPPPVHVTVGETVIVRKSTYDAEQDGDYHWRNFWLQFALTVFTAAAFGAAAYYAFYARKTYEEIQNQTQRITEQTRLLHDQLVGQQAAIIHADARIWPTGQLSMLFTNMGRVIARKPLTAEININRLRIDGTPIPNSQTKFTCTIPVIGIGDAEAKYCEEPLFGVFPRDKDLFKSTRIAIALDVRFQYDNGFGETVKDSYCSYEFNKGQDWAIQTNAYVCGTNLRLEAIPELQGALQGQY